MYCGEGTIVKKEAETYRAVTLRCRSWGCPECAPRRRRELIAFARSGRPNTFITLTVNPALNCEPWEHAKRLAEAWRTVVRRAKSRYRDQHIDYLAVFESTRRGLPHLHILARSRWIDQRWLSDQMRELINAPIVDIRRIDSPGRAAGYIAKYVGKAPHHFGKSKRYWSTRNYEIGRERTPWVHRIWTRHRGGWEQSRLTLDEWETLARRRGLAFEREGERIVVHIHGPPAPEEVPF